MAFKFEAGKDEIIQALVEKAKKTSHGSAPYLAFVQQFFATVAIDDLSVWQIEDLLALAKHYWDFMHSRAPHETKVQIFNPSLEKTGWNSPYTVIEILTEDMPFLVDSVRMVIERMGLCSHLIIHTGGLHVTRDKKNHLTKIYGKNETDKATGALLESPIWVQIDKQADKVAIEHLKTHLLDTLNDVRSATEDWMKMRENLHEVISELDLLASRLSSDMLQETKSFLSWIDDHHFTFLGMCDYDLKSKGKVPELLPLPETGLGILKESLMTSRHASLSQVMSASCELIASPNLLVMSKTHIPSTIHRNVYCDYIGIKRFNAEGEVIGERRVIGLYTSAAYNTNPKHIPFLRHKVAQVMRNSELNPRGHAGKVLLNILETLPRDDLIQASEDELLEMGMGIFHLQERRRIRLFARTDVYKQFISCLVYVPRDQFNTELRRAMQQILAEAFHSEDITYATRFSESILARVHFLVRIDADKSTPKWDFKAIEKSLIAIGRSWIDEFQQVIQEHYDEEEAAGLFAQYKNVFPSNYQDNFTPQMAKEDVYYLEQLQSDGKILMYFYEDPDVHGAYRLKVFQKGASIPLSDVLPIIENLGLRAMSERPYCLHVSESSVVWVSDYSLAYLNGASADLRQMQSQFQTSFIKSLEGETENDGFNQLILAASFDWRQVKLCRAYAQYFKQIGFTYSQKYIEATLVKHAGITQKVVGLFELKFNPKDSLTWTEREKQIEKRTKEILEALSDVSNLDEDKILRQYVMTINATLRTNYYQLTDEGEAKVYLSFKFNCQAIPNMPKPMPMYEIFVYSARLEGVHLRGGRVARGGLRWSDRQEDYRTEILGLMKAQQVKNAIIVPSGAKGGFLPKKLPGDQGREAVWKEAVACYQQFIRGLLDITDNYVKGEIVGPKQVLCYDDPDPYLVVAADKGTATFSDYANEISDAYQFWLGDAFASGGSVGYDHKKMGITAKGAWESVKRHFYEMNQNIEQNDFTVVGIGDMAGDVFGNGMLLSRRIKLLAAFNHQHIFIDPAPDAAVSFDERKRLFDLPRSSWADYDKTLISQGGGVFDRAAKSIHVTPEMKLLFGIQKQDIEPNELIKTLLTANVDLLWSGGIGTFVKAESESHLEVGDRTNDAIRVNASELKCKVIGEGGNLGLTQKARVEYDFHGGLIYTDFIDNSAGVNCSDKEVNIKILLNLCISQGNLSKADRNQLLASMTKEVSELVLRDNIEQTRAISLAASQTASTDLHIRYLHALEASGRIDRQLENIPDDKALLEYKLLGKGLGLPSLSVLQCYSKMQLKEHLLASDSELLEDPCLDTLLFQSFPAALKTKFMDSMKAHPLRREIIATKLSNIVVNEMGFAFMYRMIDETAASVSSVVRAYFIVRSILGLDEILCKMGLFNHALNAEHEKVALTLYLRLVRRMVRWILRNQKNYHIQCQVERYAEGYQKLKAALPKVLASQALQKQNALLKTYQAWGLSKALAYELSVTRPMFSALDIIEAAYTLEEEVEDVAKVYFDIEDKLDIFWIRSQVIAHPTESHWESLSREAIRDDLDEEQRYLTECLFKSGYIDKKHEKKSIQRWMERHEAGLARWQQVVTGLKSSQTLNFTMFFVAARQLVDLTEHSSNGALTDKAKETCAS